MKPNILKTYKSFLIDWDGCLAKTLDTWMDGYLKMYEKYGIETDIQEVIEKSWGNMEKGPEALGVSDPKAFIEELIAYNTEKITKVPL